MKEGSTTSANSNDKLATLFAFFSSSKSKHFYFVTFCRDHDLLAIKTEGFFVVAFF